jgi:DNA-binding MarR family transcriptional regulator
MADSLDERLGEGAVREAFVPRPLEEHMGWLMSRAGQTLGWALTEGLAPLGLNLRDYTVLLAAERAAVEGRPGSQLELARAARLDKSTMVVAVDALERGGLVERRPDPKDRRARIVAPTKAGRELLARAEGVVLGAEDEALADLGAEERRALRGLLTRLVGAGSSAGDEPDP